MHGGQLGHGFNAFHHELGAGLVRQIRERRDDRLLHVVAVATAHQRGIDFDEVGSKHSECGQACVAGTGVVQSEAQAEVTRPVAQADEQSEVLDRGAFGQLDHSALEGPEQWALPIVNIRAGRIELIGVEVDEE